MDTQLNETNEVKETETVKPPRKKGKVGHIIFAVLAACCLVASLTLNVLLARAQRESAGSVDAFIAEQRNRWAEEEKQENEYIEDGYKVGGEYEIRSTTHISDAYKNGDDSQLSAEDKETLNMAKAVLDETVKDGMTDYEKEDAVYRWMVENIGHGDRGSISRPGSRRSPFTPHDVLASKDAVCVGYATTFRLLMNMLGMDVHIVHNDYHSWDLVQLDGEWYHVDVYSDAHGVMYGNFNMTDEVAKNGHNWDESALPEAKSVKYSPAVQHAVEVEGLEAVPAALKASLDEAQGSSAVYFRFKTPLTEEDTPKAEFLVSCLRTVVDSGGLEGSYYYMQAGWYPDEDGSDILGLMLEKSDDDDRPSDLDASSPEGKAIIQAIAEAFGIDPAILGIDSGDEPGGAPIEDAIGGANGPTRTVVMEDGAVVTTWNGGGSVAIP